VAAHKGGTQNIAMILNPERVHLIRTKGYTDSYWARYWRVPVHTIRRARIGETWGDHPTPPDKARRKGTGRGPQRFANVKRKQSRATEL
jgi:hypothetical protein